MTSARQFIALLRHTADTFIKRSRRGDIDPAFWVSVLEVQCREAREHLAAGNEDAALAEIADCIPIAFEALRRCGKDPLEFTTERVTTRILPRVNEIIAKYHDIPEESTSTEGTAS